MIPICLTLQAFGPYKDKEKIDFTKFYNSKLFLITGKTGSGKTMIFDGICYALFGEASGQDRRADTFKSQFSNKEIITYVEFEFYHRDKKYIITREPEQIKISRGKEVTHRPTAKIIFGDEVITGVKNVNQIVKEILGLDYSQFKQIVMIAQGEFRKLVSADSKEREVIYRKIFNTAGFENIQNSLKEKSLELDRKIGNLNEKILGLLESVKHLKNISYEDFTLEQIIKILEQEISNYKNQICEFSESKKYFQNEIDNKKFLINKLSELLKFEIQFKNIDVPKLKQEALYLNKVKKTFLVRDKENILMNSENSYKSFVKDKNNLLDLLSKSQRDLKIFEEDFKNLEVKNLEIENLNNKILEIEILERDLEDKIKYEEDIKKFESKLEVYNSTRENIENKILNFENEKNEILKFEIENKDVGNEILKIENKIKDLDFFKINFLKYKQEVHNYEKLVSELEISTPSYNKIFDLYNQKSLELVKSEEIYLRNQAGILAKNLKENSPCMVCGSKNHPNKAKMIEDSVDESFLENLKNHVLDLQNQRNQISEKVISLKNQISFSEENLKNKYSEIKNLGEKFNIVDFEIHEEVFEKINSISENLKSNYNKLNEINGRLLKSRENILKIEEDLKNNYLEKNNIEREISKTQADISGTLLVLKQNSEKLEKHKINTKNDYLNILENLKNKRQNLINETQISKDNFKKCEDEIIKLKAQITIKDKDILNLESEIKMSKENFENSLVENGFENICDYENFKLSQNEFDKRNSFLESKRDEYRFLESSISNLKNEIGNLETSSLEIIKTNLEELNQKFSEIENSERNLSNKIMLLDSVKTNIESIGKNISESDKHRTNLNELSKISNGNNKYKVSFERYILGIYFEEIISAANIRFSKLTGGRYVFRHLKDGFDLRIQQGLDISVFDNYTSSERKINTLSGGESFKASLSLALGLSDVIQRHSGGISIDTLFIDEGFGSLDSDSLENALDCLLEANSQSKLIGIISHVQELKDFINSKIEILDSSNGSKIKSGI